MAKIKIYQDNKGEYILGMDVYDGTIGGIYLTGNSQFNYATSSLKSCHLLKKEVKFRFSTPTILPNKSFVASLPEFKYLFFKNKNNDYIFKVDLKRSKIELMNLENFERLNQNMKLETKITLASESRHKKLIKKKSEKMDVEDIFDQLLNF